MTEYKRQLSELKSELEKCGQIVELIYDLNNPTTSLEEEVFENIFQNKANVELLNFFQSSNGVKIIWKYRMANSSPEFGGECFVRPFIDLFLDEFKSDSMDLTEGATDEEIEYYEFQQKLKVLDSYDASFQGTKCTVFEFTNGVVGSMWFWDDDGDKYPLVLTVDKYFTEMIKCKAFINWQYFFIDVDAIRQNPTNNIFYGATTDSTLLEMKKFLSTMPCLFPSQDFNQYHTRFEVIHNCLTRL